MSKKKKKRTRSKYARELKTRPISQNKNVPKDIDWIHYTKK